jgi:hypothetical protein
VAAVLHEHLLPIRRLVVLWCVVPLSPRRVAAVSTS